MMKAMRPAEILMHQFCEAYNQRELSVLLSLFTQDTHMWGSGIDEDRHGIESVKDQLLRDWQQAEKSEIHLITFKPAPIDAPWAAAICQANVTIAGETYTFDNLRGTITVTQENGIWKIAHMHASFPDIRNPSNNSFPIQ